jgi:hypothetical protein
MPGFFSTVGTYMAGAARYAGRTGMGAAAGAAYGMMSDDTSVLGGAIMGAAGARYLGAGFKRAALAGRGMGLGAHALAYGKAFGTGMINRARLDYRGAMMGANRGLNRIRGLGRGIVPIA